MDTITSNAFGSIFYLVHACIIFWIVWRGYKRNTFSGAGSQMVLTSVVLFTLVYVGYRFGTGSTPQQISVHSASDPSYKWFAGIHGSISLFAILYTCVLFIQAKKSFSVGRNYFRNQIKRSVGLVVSWILMLLSGLFV